MVVVAREEGSDGEKKKKERKQQEWPKRQPRGKDRPGNKLDAQRRKRKARECEGRRRSVRFPTCVKCGNSHPHLPRKARVTQYKTKLG